MSYSGEIACCAQSSRRNLLSARVRALEPCLHYLTIDPLACPSRLGPTHHSPFSMDAIRVSRVSFFFLSSCRISQHLQFKVPGVSLHKGSRTATGTVHLTAHHLIFSYDGSSNQEMWVCGIFCETWIVTKRRE